LVVSCEHAGLKPTFKALEAELYRVLARIDNPRMVKNYLKWLVNQSRGWLSEFEDPI
jgi:hypothetical protein